MNRSDICVATITLVRDEEEEQLLRQSLTVLAQSGMKVYVTDGGSPAHFTDFLKSFPNFILTGTDAKGLLAQVTSSVSAAHAAGTPYILYAEPDKKYFLNRACRIFWSRRKGAGRRAWCLHPALPPALPAIPSFSR